MLRQCIFDNRRRLVLSKTYRSKRTFAMKFGNNKPFDVAKVITGTQTKQYEFWRYTSLYSFLERIKSNPFSMRNNDDNILPYILEERKVPKGNIKF